MSSRVASRLLGGESLSLLASMRGLSLSLLPSSSSSPSSLASASKAGIDTSSVRDIPFLDALSVRHARAFALDSRRAASGAASASASAAPEPSAEAPSAPPSPWTPTRLLNKRKTLPKRMGHLLSVLEKEKEDEARAAVSFPDFKAGDHIELKLSIPQNKGRETVFKGICIAKRNRGWRTSFTLRNFIGNNGGIERSFPLYSPHIKEFKVLREGKRVRRSKLYYLRDVQPKVYRI